MIGNQRFPTFNGMKKMNVAIIGAGTVGGGVLSMLETEKARLKKQGVSISVKTICVKSLKEKIDIPLPKGVEKTTNYKTVLADPKIDMVVELISDVKVGGDIIVAALKAGKHVVSANKAALAKNLPAILRELKKQPDLRVGFEAAIGGGIPIVGPVMDHVAVDETTRIAGILNGTTNFIISKMESEGADYHDVLKEAQALGYAEADPRADVDGYDARSKLSLLMQLLFGVNPNTQIPTVGIGKLSGVDFEYATMLGATIRCLATATREGGKVAAFVSPCIVASGGRFASVTGATNALSIDSKALQNTFLVGQGAGRFPTAGSVLADMVRITKGTGYDITTDVPKPASFNQDYTGSFYIRIMMEDQLGIVEKVGAVAKQQKISIDSILQLPITGTSKVPFVVTTDQCRLSQVESMLIELKKQKFVIGTPLLLPIISE